MNPRTLALPPKIKSMASKSINVGRKIERIWEWIFPTVVIALVPVLGQFILSLLNGEVDTSRYQGFEEIISPHGELLIVAVALVAESVSEIWKRQIPRWQKNVIGSFCIGFVILSTFIYSGLSVTSTTVSSFSFEMFAWGFLLCVICKVAGRS
ncbi:MAG: hypothetical protein AAGH78_00635 [Cyanobacteria bacterium P01_H01_bin.58]